MKTFREYLNDCRFEDIWHSIVENFSESEGIKPVYAEYFEKLKELPHKPVKGTYTCPRPIHNRLGRLKKIGCKIWLYKK